jgi:hypothetical protein
VNVMYIYNFACRHSTRSVVKSPVPCGYLLFTVLHVTTYRRLDRADYALTHVAHVSTAA